MITTLHNGNHDRMLIAVVITAHGAIAVAVMVRFLGSEIHPCRDFYMASANKPLVGPELVKSEHPKSKQKPTRTLPFDRIQFTKHLEILRAYAAATNQGTKNVTVVEASKIMRMAPETLSACNAFFTSVGFLQKGDGGFAVSAEVQSFFRAYEWNKETAAQKLEPLLRPSWFAQELLPQLSFKPMEEEASITLLADAAEARPECKKQLRLLLDYLEAAGLVQREGTLLKSGNSATASASGEAPKDAPPPDTAAPTVSRQKVATAFSQMAHGTMRFNVSFDVDMSEMANWRADRVAAFFNGIAQVLAAKAEVEKSAGS